MNRFLGDLLRLEDVREIAGWNVAFAADWAARHPLRVLALCLVCMVAAAWFYLRRQPAVRPAYRILLTLLRGAMLSLLVVLLADPVLRVSIKQAPRPLLWVLFDGSESMAIEDEMPAEQRKSLANATGIGAVSAGGGASAGDGPHARQDYVAAWVRRDKNNVLESLAKKFRLRAYLLESAESVRPLDIEDPANGRLDRGRVADQLTTGGRVTALGRGFEDLAQRHSAGNLQGVVVVSDFDQNSGPPAAEAAAKLGVPVYTVGIGPEAAVDLAVDMQAPPIMKKAERAVVAVTLRQSGLDSSAVNVSVTARPLDGQSAGQTITVGTRAVTLAEGTTTLEFPFTPQGIGRHEFVVETDSLPGEVLEENNRTVREVNIRDDFLRLMYVEYEPSWEWRFVKEVFHRDSLVGMRGFRTFLRSADPLVRSSNELFLSTAALPRRDFFATDAIFLGDMPAATLSSRFCEMTREFVEKFGGVLVVIAGKRFGPGQLAGTPLADMLPVVVDGGEKPRTDREFRLKLTADAEVVDFMRLGADDAENRKAWDNLGPLSWYQPVARPHPQATVLAAHPNDTCSDGRTPQPLIAIRRFGRGEVVYVGFNETWRLRRKYGERYYRQFWGQMIHRLGLSHALGSQKRFVVRTDAQKYESDDTAVVTVEAYDTNFEPLAEDALPDRAIVGRLLRPGRASESTEPDLVQLTQMRRGVYEARVPLAEGGEYRLRVQDPLTREESEVVFAVTTVSAERRSAVRNVALQKSIASQTAGFACDLTSADERLEKIEPQPKIEQTVKNFPLSMTWLCLGAGLLLMIGEWALRKGVNLS